MPQKEYDIAFKLAATKAGSFSAAFKAAGQSVGDLSNQIAKMDEAASDLGGLIEAREKLTQAAKSSKTALLAFQGLRKKSEELAKQTESLSQEYADAQNDLKRLEQKVRSSERASDDLKNSYEAQKRKVENLGKALKANRNEQKSVEDVTKKAQAQYEKTQKVLEKQRSAVNRLDREMRTAGQSTSILAKRQKMLEEASDDATERLEKQAAIQARIDKIAEKRAFVGKANDLANSAGGFAGRAAMSAAGAVGASGGAALSAGGALIKMGADYQAAMNKFQASTGLTAKQMQDIEASARKLYTSGLGESFSDVSNAMAAMRQVSGLTGKALEDATKNAMLLSKTFDMDVNESARASSALMKNFGISGQKAYDLIAYAAQNGANKNGDLLDTFNEYAVQYKALGFSAEEFTAHLIQGAKDGSFSIDKVGDAIKEFNIRAKDGSKSSMEAFEMLGLNGTKATQMFAQGGDRAQLAFAEVVKRLKEIDDPVRRNAAGVALFGTQFEDLEAKALDGFANIKSSAIDAKGTMDAIADLSTQDLGNQLLILSRQFQDSLAPAAKEASKALSGQMPEIQKAMQAISPYIERLGKAFIDSLPSIMRWATAIIQTTAEVGVWIVENFDKIATAVSWVVKGFIALKLALGISSIFMRVGESVLLVQKYLVGFQGALTTFKGVVTAVGGAMKLLAANPMVLTIAALAALAIAGNYIIQNWDEVKAKAVELYQSFKTNLVDAMQPLIEQFQGIWSSIQSIFTNIVDFVKNVFTGQWGAAWENVKSIFSNVFNALSGIAKAPLNTLIALINSVIKSVNGIGFDVPKWVPVVGGQKFSVNLPEIPLLAQGGIATKPTLATIGDGGEAEAVIPLSRLNQMLDPMAEPPEDAPLSRASRALFGPTAPQAPAPAVMSDQGTAQPAAITFSPTINIQCSDSNPQDIAERVREVMRKEFPIQMQRLLDQNSRLSFA